MASVTNISQGSPSVANFNSAQVLNTIVKQATGQSAIAGVDTGSFVSVANVALGISADALLGAISQVLTRTIFSIRPYTRKFKGLYKDSLVYGNHMRKLNIGDKEFEKDVRYDLVDGESIDAQIVSKPDILQTNIYGQNIYSKNITIFRDQLNIALSSEEDFQRFITMLMTNASDMIEQAHETTARATLANYINGKVVGDVGNVIHLVTEYNDITGLTLDTDSVRKPENFVPFCKWMFGRIMGLSKLMTERSLRFHTNITGHNIMRHTPTDRQKLYLFAPDMINIDTSVLSGVFHDEYLKLLDYEAVNFWQSIETPMEINNKPKYLLANGQTSSPETATATSNIMGVLFDDEAIGINTVAEWSSPTPFNARGGYSNIWWHFNDRYYNDFTENGLVFLLD